MRVDAACSCAGPTQYSGALFFADYVRNCIYVMFPGVDGQPDPSTRSVFASAVDSIADLQEGPGGDLWYVSRSSCMCIRRIHCDSGDGPPTALVTATPTYGPLPLDVTFSTASSFDPEGVGPSHSRGISMKTGSSMMRPALLQAVSTQPLQRSMSRFGSLIRSD